jgi:ComF family protein
MKCGKEIEDEEMEYCRDCREHVRSYEKGFPLFHYVPPVSDSVLAMKYKNRQEYAAFYGGELARQFGASFRQLGIQVMIPIPLHKKRLRQRGYNQAELLARAMEQELSIPVETDLLFRTGATRPQKELGDEERVRNLHAAFSVKEGKPVPERVLLVDDIYTTGSTIEACTRVLKDHGARQVYYTSICIGKV